MRLLTENGKESLAFGGQALMEGVMMRSPNHIIMCVRQPNNTLLTKVEKINPLAKRYRILGVPFLRGIVALFETFYLGVKGLYFSANAVLEEEEQFTSKEFVVVLGIALALTSVFIVVPFFIVTLLNLSGIFFNIAEAILRLSLFLLYLMLVSRWNEFERVLQYHGAEHKTINAYEAGADLNIENVRNFSRRHPRCGTSFLFIVIIVSILLFSIIPDLGLIVRLGYRLLLIPVIGAISYELLRLSDRYKNSKIVRIVTLPGLAFQNLTTKEPTDEMIEVAVTALERTKQLAISGKSPELQGRKDTKPENTFAQ